MTMEKYVADAVKLRKKLHKVPEASMKELKTKALLAEYTEKNTDLEIHDCGQWFYAVWNGSGEPIAFRKPPEQPNVRHVRIGEMLRLRAKAGHHSQLSEQYRRTENAYLAEPHRILFRSREVQKTEGPERKNAEELWSETPVRLPPGIHEDPCVIVWLVL